MPPATPKDWAIHRNNVLITNTLRSLLRLSVAGVGLGAGFRGLLGLRDLLAEKKKPTTPQRHLVLEVPVKSAQHPYTFPDEQSWLYRWALRKNPSRARGGWEEPSYIKGHVNAAGEHPKTPSAIPMATALGTLGIGGGLYGGYKLVDWLLRSNRKAELEDELEEAKQEYRTALQQQLAGRGKQAQADGQAAMSQIKQFFGDVPAWALNAYIPYALATGTLAGTLTYRAMRARQQRRLLEEAAKIRGRRELHAQPAEFEAVLAPTG